MPPDDVKGHDHDARLRKRERDRENQRQKRLREKQFVEQLQQRIELLEAELQACQSGDRAFNSSPLDIMTQLRARNEFLESRLQQIRLLLPGDNCGQVQTPGITPRSQPSNVMDVNGSENGTPDSVASDYSRCRDTPTITSHPQPNHCAVAGSLNCDVIRARSMDSTGQTPWDNAGRADAGNPDNMFRHFGESYTSIPSVTRGHASHGLEHVQDREPVPFSSLNLAAEFPWTPTMKRELDPMVPLGNLDEVLAVPDFQRLPRSGPMARLRPDPFQILTEKMQRSPEIFATYDLVPKPIDLLLGGSDNELTNLIMETMCCGPALQPEKFAIGWHCYIYTRWRIQQTQENYLRIPQTLRPTLMQYLVPHHPNLDYLLWPQIRENFIKYESKYCQDEVFGLLACCVRIRWGFNRRFLGRSNGGEPELDPEFAEKFLSLDSWGILEKFWEVYPELVVGLDRGKCLIKESHLIP